MNELSARLTRLLLLVSGAATLALAMAGLRGAVDLAQQQVQLLTAATGSGLLLAGAVASVRLPALFAALLVKISFLAAWWASGTGGAGAAAIEAVLVVVLAAIAATIARDAWREARWNGGQSLRVEP